MLYGAEGFRSFVRSFVRLFVLFFLRFIVRLFVPSFVVPFVRSLPVEERRSRLSDAKELPPRTYKPRRGDDRLPTVALLSRATGPRPAGRPAGTRPTLAGRPPLLSVAVQRCKAANARNLR